MIPTLLLDPGHGGQDPGALSPTGLRESEVVLDVCLRIRDYVGDAARVILTRDTDTFITLQERAKIAVRKGADYFLSVHCNSAKTPAHGFEVFTSPGDTKADPFATDLFFAYSEHFQNLHGRVCLEDGDPDKEAKFTVLTQTPCPAALFELEFIHTDIGDAFFRSSANREKMAAALAFGFVQHIKPRDEPQPDPIASGLEMIRNGLKMLQGGLDGKA